MTMSNLHPGFILIAVGLIALFVPKSLRRPVLAAGPLLGLGAVLTLAPGTNATLPFINGITPKTSARIVVKQIGSSIL